MSEDTTKIQKKKTFRKRKRDETDEEPEEESELIKQRLEETKILQQFRLRNKGLEVTAESVSSGAKKKDDSIQSLGEQFTSQSDFEDKLEMKMNEYIERQLASNKGGLINSQDFKNELPGSARVSKAYPGEIEPDRWMGDGRKNNVGLVQEIELPSSYKQQNIEETQIATQKLIEERSTKKTDEEDVVPRFAKEKTIDQYSAKSTDNIAFERFKRNMTNNS